MNEMEKANKATQVSCCDAQMLKKILHLIQDLTHLVVKCTQKNKTLVYYNEDEDMGEFWRITADDGNKSAQKLETWLLNYRYNNYRHSPYLNDVVHDLSLEILAGLCYWVRKSIVDLKGW
jgi:hypothetical protein